MAAPAWTTPEMQSPLPDMPASTPAAGPPRNEEDFRNAQAAGWVPRQAHDYTSRAPVVSLNGGAGPDVIFATEGDDADQVSQHAQGNWGHDAVKYEWKDEYGDVGPRDETLERQLFQGETINRAGAKLENLKTINVVLESQTKVSPIASFNDGGLHPIVLENVALCGYQDPTPIQAYGIPAVMTGHDMIGVAQTGSGKTGAMLIPVISKLMGKTKKLAAARPAVGSNDRVRAEPLVLIVAPTRELCCQIFDEARRLCYRSMLRPCVAYGGAPVRGQADQIQRGCDILIASPGRLLDFMSRPNLLSLSRVRYTIIDEADEMLHDDWNEEMSKIMGGGDANVDGDHHYLLFSATFPKRLQRLAAKYLSSDFVHISVGRTGSVHVNVKQQVMWVDQNIKMIALYDLLMAMPPSRTLIFVKFKKTADFVDDYLFNRGLPSTSIHSDRTQPEREDALRNFKQGKQPILVATGVTARGLDVRNVMHVINFDLPDIEHDGRNEYVHRIGRTARIGNEGLATSFYNEKDEPLGPFLTKILLETKQDVPDFLAQFKPEGGNLNFEEEEEPDFGDMVTDTAAAGGDTWGGGESSDTPAPTNGDAWGAGETAEEAWGSNTTEVATKAGW